MGKRLALVLLEQQDLNVHPVFSNSPPADWSAVPAFFSPWELFQTWAEAWMRLMTGLWSWLDIPSPQGV